MYRILDGYINVFIFKIIYKALWLVYSKLHYYVQSTFIFPFLYENNIVSYCGGLLNSIIKFYPEYRKNIYIFNLLRFNNLLIIC